jgi:hypothetical protein
MKGDQQENTTKSYLQVATVQPTNETTTTMSAGTTKTNNEWQAEMDALKLSMNKMTETIQNNKISSETMIASSMNDIKTGLGAEFHSLRSEIEVSITTSINEIKTGLGSEFTSIRSEIDIAKYETNQQVGGMREEFNARNHSNNLRFEALQQENNETNLDTNNKFGAILQLFEKADGQNKLVNEAIISINKQLQGKPGTNDIKNLAWGNNCDMEVVEFDKGLDTSRINNKDESFISHSDITTENIDYQTGEKRPGLKQG